MGNFLRSLKVARFEIGKHNEMIDNGYLSEDKRVHWPWLHALKVVTKYNFYRFLNSDYLPLCLVMASSALIAIATTLVTLSVFFRHNA